MHVKIGDIEYELNTSFMTAFLYRVKYKESILEARFNRRNNIQLLHTAIVGAKPLLHILEQKAETDGGLLLSVSASLRLKLLERDESIKSNKPKIDNEKKRVSDDFKIDEYEMMALFAHTGLDYELLSQLSLMQMAHLICTYHELKNRGQEQDYQEMTNDEIKQFYSITPQIEEQIRVYREKRHGKEAKI